MDYLSDQLAALDGSDKSTRLLLERLIVAQKQLLSTPALEPDFPYSCDPFDRQFFGAVSQLPAPKG